MQSGLRGFNPMDHPRIFRLIINTWPPYLGSAISVRFIAPDWRTLRVTMKLRWYNRNYVNSHFGGNLFSMTDPFYMLMLMRNLGRDYIVWDTAAQITFLRPGHGQVSALFHLDPGRLEEIKQNAAKGDKLLEKFRVDVVDEQGGRVASVKKTLYIRKKGTRAIDRGKPEEDKSVNKREAASPRIHSSSWGKMAVDGLGPGKDFKLWPGGGRTWDWSEHGTGHGVGIRPGDVAELIDHGCEVVILTTGRLGRLRVAQPTLDILHDKGVEVIVADTGEGIALYNEIARQGRAVGGLFHSTC